MYCSRKHCRSSDLDFLISVAWLSYESNIYTTSLPSTFIAYSSPIIVHGRRQHSFKLKMLRCLHITCKKSFPQVLLIPGHDTYTAETGLPWSNVYCSYSVLLYKHLGATRSQLPAVDSTISRVPRPRSIKLPFMSSFLLAVNGTLPSPKTKFPQPRRSTFQHQLGLRVPRHRHIAADRTPNLLIIHNQPSGVHLYTH